MTADLVRQGRSSQQCLLLLLPQRRVTDSGYFLDSITILIRLEIMITWNIGLPKTTRTIMFVSAENITSGQ